MEVECLPQNDRRSYTTFGNQTYQPLKWNETILYKYQKQWENDATNNQWWIPTHSCLSKCISLTVFEKYCNNEYEYKNSQQLKS